MPTQSRKRLCRGARSFQYSPVRPINGSPFLIEYYSDTVFRRIFQMWYHAVKTEDPTYIHYVDLGGMDELYDLSTDPYELENRIGDPQFSDVLDELRSELGGLLEETGAGGKWAVDGG